MVDQGQGDLGARFVVQHNGLQPQPPRGSCANEDKHPARGPYTRVGAGCPNRWVLEAGADGRTVTGFQTTNAQQVNTPAHTEGTLGNAWVNSDGVFVEIYEEAGRDFYQIPLDLHSPAVLHINNLNSGRTFSAGEINYDVLRRSFFGE